MTDTSNMIGGLGEVGAITVRCLMREPCLLLREWSFSTPESDHVARAL
jgi:hypothetical protein